MVATKNLSKPAPKKAPVSNDENKERGLSESKVKVLRLLKKFPEGLTRAEMGEKTGIKKGWSKMLGAPTKGDSNGMEGAGLVKHAKFDDRRGIVYTITSAGKKALEQAEKSAK